MSVIEIGIDDATLLKLEKLTKDERAILIADIEEALRNRVNILYKSRTKQCKKIRCCQCK